MKQYFILVMLATALLGSGCVQKAYKRTVVLSVDVSAIKNIQSVGVRGEGKPFSWQEDIPATVVKKDSLYTATITTVTGYKVCEIKFTVNGQFELQDKPNRNVTFTGDTTRYYAVFDKVK